MVLLLLLLLRVVLIGFISIEWNVRFHFGLPTDGKIIGGRHNDDDDVFVIADDDNDDDIDDDVDDMLLIEDNDDDDKLLPIHYFQLSEHDQKLWNAKRKVQG